MSLWLLMWKQLKNFWKVDKLIIEENYLPEKIINMDRNLPIFETDAR